MRELTKNQRRKRNRLAKHGRGRKSARGLAYCQAWVIGQMYAAVRREGDTPAVRLKMLRRYGCRCCGPCAPIGLAAARKRFEDADILLGHECWVCGGPAVVRHHVVPLSHGGNNNPKNIVSLCLVCHAKAHPWLAEQIDARVEKGARRWGIGPPPAVFSQFATSPTMVSD